MHPVAKFRPPPRLTWENAHGEWSNDRCVNCLTPFWNLISVLRVVRTSSSEYTPQTSGGVAGGGYPGAVTASCPFAALAEEQTRLRFDPLTGASWYSGVIRGLRRRDQPLAGSAVRSSPINGASSDPAKRGSSPHFGRPCRMACATSSAGTEYVPASICSTRSAIRFSRHVRRALLSVSATQSEYRSHGT